MGGESLFVREEGGVRWGGVWMMYCGGLVVESGSLCLYMYEYQIDDEAKLDYHILKDLHAGTPLCSPVFLFFFP